ncbi:MAG: hypothetical protein NVS3B12_07740 [Acidimicrobiales bacterium]
MRSPSLSSAIREHLAALAAALGGSWALVEVSEEGPRAVGTSAGLAAELAGPGYRAALARARSSGVVLQLGTGRTVHPSAGRAATGQPVSRVLVGDALRDGPPAETLGAIVAIVGDTLNSVAEAAGHAEEQRRHTERLELRAATDPLTGLLNRRGWDRLLVVEDERCARHSLDAETVIVDLDGLKAVNDHQGHEAGDALIVRAATFIFSAVRIHDAVARLGGDEFGILSVGGGPSNGVVAARIADTLAEAEIAASVGWADRSSEGDLLRAVRAADLGMYRVKQQRRRLDPERDGAGR